MTRTINGIEFPDVEPMLLQTTPRLLRDAGACASGYRKALKGAGLGPDSADVPINLLSILEGSGLNDFFWAMPHVLPGQEASRNRALRLMAAEFAAVVLHHFEAECPDDKRPRLAIEAARDFAMGKIVAASRAAAQAAARAAARATAHTAAEGAAQAAAHTAAEAAARAASRATSRATAEATQHAVITRYLKA